MDRRQSKRVSDLRQVIGMKRILTVMLALLTGCCIAVSVPSAPAEASGKNSTDVSELLGNVKEKLSEAVSGMDQETVKEIFDFIQEKVKDGSLKTDAGLKEAIQEGETKFNVTIEEEDARQVVDAMEKLESMGFSGEYVLEKAEELYDRYGAGFVDHMDELAADAIQNAVTNAAGNFFGNLWQSTKSFFKNFLGGL